MYNMNVSDPTNPWVQMSSNSQTELNFTVLCPSPRMQSPSQFCESLRNLSFPLAWAQVMSLSCPQICFWILPFYYPCSACGCSPANWYHISPRLFWATPPCVLGSRRESTAVYFGSHFVTWEQSSMACAFVPHTIFWDNNWFGFCLRHLLSQNLGLNTQGQLQGPKSTSNTILTSLPTSSHCINCTSLILPCV